ncbi:hypothetical protein [Kitasatospora sp. NPDC097643]|uniref:hypothetical protein n=1 Tax=Kitasatospora sp. NPDC097643 TaxID=3157230 RepID=UPI003319A960
MSDGQGYGGAAGGYGPGPQQHPYGQQGGYGPNPYAGGPYPQQGPVPANPYAQPVPPQPVPPQPVPPQPVPARQVPPQGGSAAGPDGYPGPAPRRSRTGVLLQFALQWIYAPLWIAALVAFFLLLLFSDSTGPSGGDGTWLKVNRTFIPPRRLKAELTGRPEDWERYVTPILVRRFATAEAEYAAGGGELRADGARLVGTRLALRLYRGLGAAGVVRIAERHGWYGVPAEDKVHVRLGRSFPAPARIDAPAPHDPPAAPGTPWGPQPHRFAPLLPLIMLLQIGYVPLYGAYCLLTGWVTRPDDHWDRWGARWTVGPRAFWPEFSHRTAAWDHHVRRILARDTRRELARPAEQYRTLTAPDGTFHRRIRINRATYRGIGAHHALRIAAEAGWTLDPAYTPDPATCLRLRRPDHH